MQLISLYRVVAMASLHQQPGENTRSYAAQNGRTGAGRCAYCDSMSVDMACALNSRFDDSISVKASIHHNVIIIIMMMMMMMIEQTHRDD